MSNKRFPAKRPYILVIDDRDHKGITCVTCGLTSWNALDIAQQYCGNCSFHMNLNATVLSPFERLLYGFKKVLKPESGFVKTSEDCDTCNPTAEIDYENTVHRKTRKKLVMTRDPKKRAELWLQGLVQKK